MLKNIAVSNYKNFNEETSLNLLENNKVKKIVTVHGENGSGKSNLGKSIFDIQSVLTSKPGADKNKHYSSNLNRRGNPIIKALFEIDGNEIFYSYEKTDSQDLIFETLKINNKIMVDVDHTSDNIEVNFINTEHIHITEDLKYKSVVKYLNEMIIEQNDPDIKAFKLFMKFINNMLYIDATTILSEDTSYETGIINKGKIDELQNILETLKLGYKIEGGKDGKIYLNYNGYKVPFNEVASNGTKTLVKMFYWLTDIDNFSLLFIDEYDALFNSSLSDIIIDMVASSKSQTILTSNNENSITNSTLPTNSLYNIKNNKIAPIKMPKPEPKPEPKPQPKPEPKKDTKVKPEPKKDTKGSLPIEVYKNKELIGKYKSITDASNSLAKELNRTPGGLRNSLTKISKGHLVKSGSLLGFKIVINNK